MRSGRNRLLAVLLVLVVCVVAFGFYRGWFALSTTSSDTGSNKVDINLTVDPDKVKADAEAVTDKTAEITGTSTEKATDSGGQSQDK